MTWHGKPIWRRLLLAAVSVLGIAACSRYSGERGYDVPERPDTLSLMIRKWSHYISSGRQDSIVLTAAPLYRSYAAAHDTVGVQCAGVYLAQAYVLLNEDYGSTKALMDSIKPYFNAVSQDPDAASVYWNVAGNFALKYELDYAEALSCYLNAYQYAERKRSVNSQIVVLFNIVNIYYVRFDSHGVEYAEEALALSRDPSAKVFQQIAANIAMAQVRYLSGKPEEALSYLQKAHIMTVSDNVPYYNPIIQLLYGDIFAVLGDFDRAAQCYETALDCSSYSEPSTVALIYLNYARMRERLEDYDEALRLYSMGLALSEQTRNLEFYEELMDRFSSLLYDTGRKELASEWYRKRAVFVDSFTVERNEHAFSDRQLYYAELGHDYEAARQEAALSESRRRLATSLAVTAVVIVLAAVFVVMYMRQRRMYRELVARYEEYRRRLKTEADKTDSGEPAGAGTDCAGGDMRQLYLRIEALMREGAFKARDMSLDKLAQLSGANRTYVSNAINQMAGCNFYQYLDSYRVKEAARILSDPELSAEVQLKALAYDVGYNSQQVFNKAFKKETGVTPGIFKYEALKIRKKADE